jgi:RNA polymerase sigma factor (sigma-70 family)
VASNPITSLLHNLRRSALLHDGAERTDGQLLEAFHRNRDPLALEVLVRRHAPMVWGVCRRTLAQHHEAEDAFQATFLVLLRKAASIRTPELLPNWLYRVAYRTARKARQRAAQRCAREKQVKVLPEPPAEPHTGTIEFDLRAVIDEELGRLPEKYRIAVILCDLEERTRPQAARQLRLPEGTVASRLATGRALLARRLLRRGLGVSAAGLATAGFQQAASGAVPAALLANTAKAVSLLAAGDAAPAGLVSAGVSPLADSVLRAMAVAKQKTAGVVLVVAALGLAGGLVTCHTLAARWAPRLPAPSVPGNGGLFAAAEAPGEVMCFPVEDRAQGVAFSPDCRRIVIGTVGVGVPVRVCDVSTGDEVWRTIGYDWCWTVAYAPDGESIAVGFAEKSILILDARTGEVRRELPSRGARSVCFSPDSRLLAAWHGDRRLRLWDVAGGRVVHDLPGDWGAVHDAAFTPDGKQLLVIGPGTVLRLYEVASGKEVRRFEGHLCRISDVAVSADGRRALSCSLDKTIRLWDLQTGQELRRLETDDGGLRRVAFCPDGRRALSSGYGKTLRLWDLTTGQELYRFAGHDSIVNCVAVSPDGRHAVSASGDQTVRLWRLPDPAPAPGP